MKKKKNKKKKKKKKTDADDSGDDMVSVATFKGGDHISIVEGSNTVIAHGVMLDDEPDVHEIFRDQDMVHEASRVPSHWCIVAITEVVRGCAKMEIDSGHVFHTSGAYLAAAERTISALHEEYAKEGFVLFHQWVVRRVRRTKFKPKSRGKPRR